MDSFGNRLKAIRGMLGLNREQFSKRCGIPGITVRSWELSKTHISRTQLTKLIKALAKENIHCTPEWLLEGEGLSPFSRPHNTTTFRTDIQQEIDLFLRNNPNAMVQTIKDTLMSPYYEQNDYVGGIKIDLTEIHKVHEKPAIIFIKGSKTPLVRLVVLSPNEAVHLLHTNTREHGYNYLFNVKVQDLYQIIWYRKPTL